MLAPPETPVQLAKLRDERSKEWANLAVQAKSLARLEPRRSMIELGLIWAQILGLIGLYVLYPAAWLLPVLFVLIGARQYGLLILLHDASHTLLHPKKAINDRIALWFIAAPCGSSYFNSRRLHLGHHQNLGHGPDDPDYFYYCSGEPAPKQRLWDFIRYFVFLMGGLQVAHTLLERLHRRPDQSLANNSGQQAAGLAALIPVVIVQSFFLAAFTLAGIWWAYFVLWFLPLVTLAVLFNGLRTFCDHANVGPDLHDKDHLMMTYVSSPIERFFLAPYHMNYHAEHHLFPYVPHYNLPQLRELLKASPEVAAKIQWRGSYVRFIASYLFSK